MSFGLHIIPALKDNFIYALVSDGVCTVIDPGEAAPVRSFLKSHGLKLERILCTHHHWDHVSGVPELADEWNCPVLVSEYDRSRISHATGSLPPKSELYGETLEILAMPGHTQGQIAYHFPQLKIIFTGDTIFSAGCGRLLEGTHEQMHTTLQKLAALPGDTKIYFGHEYTLRNLEFAIHHGAVDLNDAAAFQKEARAKLAAGKPTTPTTVGDELKINPFLKANSLQEFTRWRELRNVW